MFKNNTKSENGSKKSSFIPGSTSHQLNSLVKGTSVEGSINAESDIRVDGKLSGNLSCKSKVIIGPTGMISGEVHCQNAVIEGRFEGTLIVAELVDIREQAQVQGEVSSKKINVQPGANLKDFRYNMNSSAAGQQPKSAQSRVVKAKMDKEEAAVKEAS